MLKKISLLTLLTFFLLCIYAQNQQFLTIDAGISLPLGNLYKPGAAAQLSLGQDSKKKENFQSILSLGFNAFTRKEDNKTANIASLQYGINFLTPKRKLYISLAAGLFANFYQGGSSFDKGASAGLGYLIPVNQNSRVNIFAKFMGGLKSRVWESIGIGYQFGNKRK